MVADSRCPFRFHPDAFAEAAHEARYYRERDPRLGPRFTRALRDASDRVRRRPETYPRYLHGTRRLPIDGFPFMLIYRIQHQALQYVAVAHTSRRPGYWRERLED